MGAPQSIRSAGGVPAQCLRCCSGVRAEPCGDAHSPLRGRHRNGAAARSRVQRAAVGWRSTSSTCCRRARPVPQLPTCTLGWGAPACTPLPSAPNSSSAPNPRSGCARAVSTLLSAGVGGCRAACSGIAPPCSAAQACWVCHGSLCSSVILHRCSDKWHPSCPAPAALGCSTPPHPAHILSCSSPSPALGVGVERTVHPGPMYLVSWHARELPPTRHCLQCKPISSLCSLWGRGATG